jgi:hypothetical protein
MVTTGPISLGGNATSGGLNQSVNIELGRAATDTINMNDSAVRSLAGVPSGAISMNNFYGKSNAFVFNRTISANTQNYNLLNDMVASGYVNGSGFTANITINSGVYVWSDNTSLAGFDTGNITGTGTINLVNSGFIIGRGGNGNPLLPNNPGPPASFVNPGSPGGAAINTVRPMTITNNSFIAGGGGGGATTETRAASGSASPVGSGGGAGGGTGGVAFFYSTGIPASIAPGGAGGGLGSSGSNGNTASGAYVSGGGGGRILPGVGGAARTVAGASSGAGGSAGSPGGNSVGATSGFSDTRVPGLGGGAGGSGAIFGIATKVGQRNQGGGGGGGWGAIGGNGNEQLASRGPGGNGGKAINTNGNSVTFVTTGTVYGAVS